MPKYYKKKKKNNNKKKINNNNNSKNNKNEINSENLENDFNSNSAIIIGSDPISSDDDDNEEERKHENEINQFNTNTVRVGDNNNNCTDNNTIPENIVLKKNIVEFSDILEKPLEVIFTVSDLETNNETGSNNSKTLKSNNGDEKEIITKTNNNEDDSDTDTIKNSSPPVKEINFFEKSISKKEIELKVITINYEIDHKKNYIGFPAESPNVIKTFESIEDISIEPNNYNDNSDSSSHYDNLILHDNKLVQVSEIKSEKTKFDENVEEIVDPNVKYSVQSPNDSFDKLETQENNPNILELSDTSSSIGEIDNPPLVSEAESEESERIDKDVGEIQSFPVEEEHYENLFPTNDVNNDIENKEAENEADYKLRKAKKRVALQTHFLPQFINPRYLDSIKEESSDQSDVDKINDILSKLTTDLDELDDDVFYDNNSIINKANAIYPKINLDFGKNKKPYASALKQPETEIIREENTSPIQMEAEIIEQQQLVEESCSTWLKKSISPESESAEIIFINSTSSSSSDLVDLDQENFADDESTENNIHIETPTIEIENGNKNNIYGNSFTPPTQINAEKFEDKNTHPLSNVEQTPVNSLAENNINNLKKIEIVSNCHLSEQIIAQNNEKNLEKNIENISCEFEISETSSKNMLALEPTLKEHIILHPISLTRQESNESHNSDHSQSTVKSQVTTINTETQPESLTDLEFKDKTNSLQSNNNSESKTLRQLCVDRLASMPCGIEVLEELASVANSLNSLTEKHQEKYNLPKKDISEENINMPYPLPDVPKIDNITINKSDINNHSTITLSAVRPNKLPSPPPPPVPVRPRKESWTAIPTIQDPKVLVCLSPGQKQFFDKSDQKTINPDQLLDMHTKFVDRRGYNELSSEQIFQHQKHQNNLTKIHEIMSSTQLKRSSPPPPPVPPLPISETFSERENFLNKNIKNFNTNNSTVETNKPTRLLAIIRDVSSEQQQTENKNNFAKEEFSRKENFEISHNKSEDNNNVNKNIKEKQEKTDKIFKKENHLTEDKSNMSSNFPSEDYLKFLNNDLYFKPTIKRLSNIETTSIPFCSEFYNNTNPKRYSNIETSSFEKKKLIKNGEVIYDIIDSDHQKHSNLDDKNLIENFKEINNKIKTDSTSEFINRNQINKNNNNETSDFDEFRQRAKDSLKAKSEFFNRKENFFKTDSSKFINDDFNVIYKNPFYGNDNPIHNIPYNIENKTHNKDNINKARNKESEKLNEFNIPIKIECDNNKNRNYIINQNKIETNKNKEFNIPIKIESNNNQQNDDLTEKNKQFDITTKRLNSKNLDEYMSYLKDLGETQSENIAKPLQKETEICFWGKRSNIKAPRISASVFDLTSPKSNQSDDFDSGIYDPTSSRRKRYFSSCSMVENEFVDQTPITSYVSPRSPRSRASLPRELHDKQSNYLAQKEYELKNEVDKLEDDRRRLIDEIEKMQESRRQSRRYSFTQNLPASEEEIFRQQMHNEWMNKVAEREERRLHKIIKITKPIDDLTSTDSIAKTNRKSSIDISDEFLRRVKERRSKLCMPSDSDWESGAESQPIIDNNKTEVDVEELEDKVKVLEGKIEADLKKLPKHLLEFADFVKKFEEEHKSSLNLNDGTWNSNTQKSSENKPPTPPPLPVWSSEPSPTANRKEFRPVKFESPTLPRKYVCENPGPVAPPPWKTDSNNKIKEEIRLHNKTSSDSNLNQTDTQYRTFGSTSSILQKVRELEERERAEQFQQQQPRPKVSRNTNRFAKPNEIVFSVKNDYLSEPEYDNDRPKIMAQLARIPVEGIGPTTKDGMPIVLRSEVKENKQHEWYKKMFQTLHKAKDGDEVLTIRYKSPKGRYPYKTNGYMSEPEPNYDSDYTTMKYTTLDRRRTPSTGNTQDDRSYGTMPNPVKPGSVHYKNQPGRIENFRPGHSSVSEKERREWWDEVMEIFNSQWEQQKLSPNYTEGNLSRALKEQGYESDSNLIFRKKEESLQSPLSPVEQKQYYRNVQAGGEPPLFGFRKKAPEKPKDDNEIEYLPITSTLTKIRVHNRSNNSLSKSLCIPTTSTKSIDTFSSYNVPSFVPVSRSYTEEIKGKRNTKQIKSPPTPPNRNSSKTRTSTAIQKSRLDKQSTIKNRHTSCFQTEHIHSNEPIKKYDTITLRKSSRSPSVFRSKSTGAVSKLLSAFGANKNTQDSHRSRCKYSSKIRLHSISPPSRPTSRLTSLRQSSHSPIAFGRSISKERAFAVEKKRLEETLPLCKKSFNSSTNILRDPSFKSPDEVKRAVQDYAHSHCLVRSKSAPHKITIPSYLRSTISSNNGLSKVCSKKRNDVEKSVSISIKKKSAGIQKEANFTNKFVSKQPSLLNCVKNKNFTRSNSTFSIDSNGSKRPNQIKKPLTILGTKKNNEIKIASNERKTKPLSTSKSDSQMLKNKSSFKKEIKTDEKNQTKFFQNLFLRGKSPISCVAEPEYDSYLNSVQEKAKLWGSTYNKSETSAPKSTVYLNQKKLVSDSKFLFSDEQNQSITSAKQIEIPKRNKILDQISKFNSYYQLTDEESEFEEQYNESVWRLSERSRSEPRSKTYLTEIIHPNSSIPTVIHGRVKRSYSPTNEIHENDSTGLKKTENLRSFSPTREVRINPEEPNYFTPNIKKENKAEYSPTREVRIHPNESKCFSAIQMAHPQYKDRSFSPTREIRIDPSEPLSYYPLKEGSNQDSYSPTREIRIPPNEQIIYTPTLISKSRDQYSPTREVRIHPDESRSYSPIFPRKQEKPSFSPTREVRVNTNENISYVPLLDFKKKDGQYSPTREIRIDPQEYHSYSPTCIRKSRDKKRTFSPTREIRIHPKTKQSYSANPFLNKAGVTNDFSPTREIRVSSDRCHTSFVPYECLKGREPRSFSPTREIRLSPERSGSKYVPLECLKQKEFRSFSPTREVRVFPSKNNFSFSAKENSYQSLPKKRVEVTKTRKTSPIRDISISQITTREVRSPSRRRIQSFRVRGETNKIIRASSLSSADDRSKRKDTYHQCSDFSHSTNSLNFAEHKSRHTAKFLDLNRFYNNIERFGQLERATSSTDIHPIRREGEVIDFDEWKKIRAHERAEKELYHVVNKLKQDEVEKDFLFRPKDPNDLKWNHIGDSGLRCKDKSVEDLRENFENKIKYDDFDADKKFEQEIKKDTYKPYWRGSSVADLANTMVIKYNPQTGNYGMNKIKKIDNKDLHLSKNLISTLSKEQVNKIKTQLHEIYSTNPQEVEKVEEECVITVDEKSTKNYDNALKVRCKSSISAEELLGPVLKKKQLQYKPIYNTDSLQKKKPIPILAQSKSEGKIFLKDSLTEREKKRLSQNVSKELKDKVQTTSSSTVKKATQTITSKKSQLSNVSSTKSPISPKSSRDNSSEKFSSNASDGSKVTVIFNRRQSPHIQEAIKYFEEKKDEEPAKVIYHAREDSSPDEDEIIKAVEENRKHTIIQTKSKHDELCSSATDLKDMFGEVTRVNFRIPQPPPPPDKTVNDSVYNFRSSNGSIQSFESLYRSRSISPLSERIYSSYLNQVQTGDVQKIKSKYESLGYRESTNPFENSLKKHYSDPDLKKDDSKSTTVKKHEVGDVSLITHKFETKNAIERSRTKTRRTLSPSCRIKRDDLLMPHIDIISKTVNLKKDIKKNQNYNYFEHPRLPAGTVERIRSIFESPNRKQLLCGGLSTSSPDICELKDISTYLTGDWIAHKYPKYRDNARSPIFPEYGPISDKIRRRTIHRPSSSSPPRSKTLVTSILKPYYDVFANQKFDPLIHRPKARYVPSDDNNKQRKKYETGKSTKETDVVDDSSISILNHDVSLGDNIESPHRYYESDVNIHYKTPIRYECKDIIPEEELARSQAETMRKLYEEERRRKYIQELQDMNNRRHADNFIPSQKSPIPLNRYDEFNADLPEQIKGPRTVAKALYNFQGQTARELSFKKGETIYIRKQIDKNWYEGDINGAIGLLPANYVEIIAKDGIRTQATTSSKKPSEGQARAKYNFQAQSGVELSVNKGELVILTRRVDDNWFEGKIANRKGIFPVSYVDVLTDIGAEDQLIKPTSSSVSHSQFTTYQPSLDKLRTSLNNEFNSLTNGHHHPTGILKDSRSIYNTDILHVDTDSQPITYRALYKYRPQNNDELDLQEGDIIHVLEKCDDGWYVGTSQRTGCFGTFPGNYVERIHKN